MSKKIKFTADADRMVVGHLFALTAVIAPLTCPEAERMLPLMSPPREQVEARAIQDCGPHILDRIPFAKSTYAAPTLLPDYSPRQRWALKIVQHAEAARSLPDGIGVEGMCAADVELSFQDDLAAFTKHLNSMTPFERDRNVKFTKGAERVLLRAQEIEVEILDCLVHPSH